MIFRENQQTIWQTTNLNLAYDAKVQKARGSLYSIAPVKKQ